MTEHGQIIDSVSDFVFLTVLLIIVIYNVKIPLFFIMWICSIAFIKLLSFAAGIIKFRKLYTVHSVLNKLTGITVFISVFFLNSEMLSFTLGSLCCIASVACIEELLIVCFSHKFNPDIKSIIAIKKE